MKKITTFAEKKKKDMEYVLKDMPLPDCLLDINREELAIFVANNKGTIALRTLQEVFHSYDYLFDVVKTARYNYYLSCKNRYTKDFELEGENVQWIQLQFLSSSLMWYNASFDVILQCIWIFYGLYYDKTRRNSIKTNNIKDLQEQCSFDSIINHERCFLIDTVLLEKLKKLRSKRDTIACFVNKFKHNSILTKGGERECFFIKIIRKPDSSDEETIYDSSETQKEINFSQAKQAIKNYHKILIEFVSFMNEVFEKQVRNDVSKGNKI